MNPPRAPPSADAESCRVAPRARSWVGSHTPVSFPPLTGPAASTKPSSSRAPKSRPTLWARPVTNCVTAQIVMTTASTRRGPILSTSHPAGICIAAYVQKNELMSSPSTAGAMCRSSLIAGRPTDSADRSM